MRKILLLVLCLLVASFAYAMPPDGTGGWTVSGDTTSTPGNVAIGGSVRLPQYTVATLPSSPTTGDRVEVTDGDGATDCTVGSGSDIVTCRWSGAAWVNAGDGVSAEVVTAAVGDAGDADTTHAYSKDNIRDYVYIADPDFDGLPSVLDAAVTGPTSISTGATPASTGAVRLTNNSGMFGRNNANDGDIQLIGVDPSDIVYVGAAGADQIVVATNGTGTVEVQLPEGSIDSTEILDGTIAVGDLNADLIVTAAETAASNDNDTTVPTTAAMIDYADSVAAGGGVPTTGGTMTGNLVMDDGSTDSPSIVLTDETDETTTITKLDGAYTTVTTAAADGINILVGNLKVGDGSPGQTIDGEDAYINGLLEVDGAIYADGSLAIADGQTITFQEATAHPDDANVILSGNQGVLKIDTDDGPYPTNDLTIDIGSTSSKVKISATDTSDVIELGLQVDFTKTVKLDDGDGASPILYIQDETDEVAYFQKLDSGYLTLTTEAADGLQVLVGNLKVGGGTPGQTLDGADSYVTGLLEVDGVIHADGGVTGNLTGTASSATAAASQVITDNAILTVDDAAAADGQVAVFTADGIEGHASVTDTELAYLDGVTAALSGFDSENEIEALIFDADAESVTGVWTVADDVLFNFGTGSDFGIRYDETTDDQLEIVSNSSSDTEININNAGDGATNLTIDGTIAAEGFTAAAVADPYIGFNSTGTVLYIQTDAGDYFEFSSSATAGSDVFFKVAPAGITLPDGVIFIKEQAEADADVEAYGQIWVNTATPNELYFTDDAGTDHQLGIAGSDDQTWNEIGAPTADLASTWDDNEILSFSFADTNEDMLTISGVGAFGDVSVMKIAQATGDATDGTVLEVVAADANVDPLVVSSSGQANALVVGQGAGAVDVAGAFTAGTIGSDGAVTATTNLVIGDAGNIGSASDGDAIAIAANGVVTLSQIPVLPADSIDYADTAGSYKAMTPMTGDADDFDDNFTGANLYGGTYVCNAEGTVILPAVTAGMNFTIITLGDIAVVIDPNASDSMLSDGVQGADGENLTNGSSAGDIAVVQYYSAAGWLVTSNGWTAE